MAGAPVPPSVDRVTPPVSSSAARMLALWNMPGAKQATCLTITIAAPTRPMLGTVNLY
jgi:hypothetical protein